MPLHKTSSNPFPIEHLAIVDALYRFGAGVDRCDESLLAMAFSNDAVVDITPCGRKMGLEFPVLTGRETIVRFLGATGERQTTTHVVTNPRVTLSEGLATLSALVEATHLIKDDHSRWCRTMNWYAAELVLEAGLWRIRRLVIDGAWFTGNVQVLTGN